MVYTLGSDKRISVVSIDEEQHLLEQIKCSNAHPKRMVLHEQLQRLYVTMKEGALFIFDVREATPVVIHSFILPVPVSRMIL